MSDAEKCQRCDGTGEISDPGPIPEIEFRVDCPDCGGTGRVQPSQSQAKE